MNIAEIAPGFKSLGLFWQALIATAVAVAALAAGWNPVLSFYRWCIAKHDGKILHILKEWLRDARLKHSVQYFVLSPAPLAMIAGAANRSERSVYKSLRRLENAGSVEEVKTGWILKGQEIPKPRPKVTRL